MVVHADPGDPHAERTQQVAHDFLGTLVPANVDWFAVEISEALDLRASDDVDFLDMESCDERQLLRYVTEFSGCFNFVDEGYGCDRHVDARKREQIAGVLYTAGANRGKHAQGQLAVWACLLALRYQSRDLKGNLSLRRAGGAADEA